MNATSLSTLSNIELHQKGLSVSVELHRYEGILIDILAEVKKRRLFEHYGCTNLFDYAEKFFKLSKSKTYDLIQIIQASERVPELTLAIKQGEAEYTKIRTIAPVVNRGNAKELLEKVKSSTTRELEQLVRKINPEVQVKPAPKPRWLSENKIRRTLDLSAEQESFLMKAWERVNQKMGQKISLEDALLLLAQSYLGGGEKKNSKTVVVIQTDQDLKEGYIHTEKGKVYLQKETLEKHLCEGEILVQSQEKTQRARAIPTQIRNHVFKRDHGKCQVPDCQKTTYLIPHHIKHFSEGGEHEAQNLVLVCWNHHKGIHEGRIEVSGNAEMRGGMIWKINSQNELNHSPTWASFRKERRAKKMVPPRSKSEAWGQVPLVFS